MAAKRLSPSAMSATALLRLARARRNTRRPGLLAQPPRPAFARRAFALVVDTLLRKGDYRAALALMTSWIGQVEQVPLEDGRLLPCAGAAVDARPDSTGAFVPLGSAELGPRARRPSTRTLPQPLPPQQRRELVLKFFDYLEANAEDYWQAPALDTAATAEDESEGKDLYGAAYEDVTYQDSTDDNQDSSVDDGGPRQEFDLEHQAEPLEKRLHFLSTLARLWQIAARFLRGTSMTANRRPPAANMLPLTGTSSAAGCGRPGNALPAC